MSTQTTEQINKFCAKKRSVEVPKDILAKVQKQYIKMNLTEIADYYGISQRSTITKILNGGSVAPITLTRLQSKK